MSEHQQKWLYVIPVALALGILLPYLGKAYTIDDPLFLMQAQQALRDPLHPTAFDVVWSDNKLVRCSAIMPSGPVQAFLLIPTILAGGSEVVAHTTQLVMLLLGLWVTICLGRRLGLSVPAAALAATAVASSPAILGMAGTAMPDIAATTLGNFGLLCLLAWKQKRGAGWAVVAVVALAVASLARPHALGFLGIGFLLLGVHHPNARLGGRLTWRILDLVPLVAAFALVALYGRVSADPAATGGTLASATQSLSTIVEPERHFLAFLSHWSLTTPVPLLLVALRRGSIRWAIVGYLSLPFGALVAGLGFFKQTWVGVFAALSVAAIVELWRTPRLSDRAVHHAFMFAMLMPLGLILYVHLPAKYLATSIPAAAILIGAEFDALARDLATQPRWLVALIASICLYFALVGRLVLAADTAYGELTIRAANEFVRHNVARNQRVWFAGHWGFQWYATRFGGNALSIDAHPAPRDLLVTPSKNHDGAYLPDKFPNRAKVDRLYDNESPVHVMHHGIIGSGFGAGFYSNWWGLLPVVVGHGEMEQWELWEFTYQQVDP